MKLQLNKLLTINHIHTCFEIKKHKYYALRDVSLCLYENEILAIVGESGSGKSVLMKTIMGLLPEKGTLESGEIILHDSDISRYTARDRHKIRGKEIAMIFQDQETALNPLRTIGFHLEEIIKRSSSLKGGERKEKALFLLSAVGIENADVCFHKYPHELSGGMRQRVLIAMALACDSRIIIADEPTTALDVTVQAQILGVLKALKQDSGKSLFFITHDLAVAASVCDRIVIMYGSRIMEEMPVEELFIHARHPYTRALLQAMPFIGEEPVDRFATIGGTIPSIETIGTGCPFYERCSEAGEVCKHEFPAAVKIAEGHYSYCHRR